MNKKLNFEIDLMRPEGKFSPWGGHREAAYYLTKTLKPNVIVELGTHWGVSFFSFLQSIKDNDLSTTVYAIDTWQGEEHVGLYGEEVFEFVKKNASTTFEDVDYKLVRAFFSDAVHEFEDNSIDIVHIDGLHTYEATKEDFDTWLPKLAKHGIILFHDIAADVEYGSKDFWLEVANEYPHFEIDHSWGLGILFPKGSDNYKKLSDENFGEKLKVFKYKYLSELYSVQVEKAEKLINDKDLIIKQTERLAEERWELIRATETIAEERLENLRHAEEKIRELSDERLINKKILQNFIKRTSSITGSVTL